MYLKKFEDFQKINELITHNYQKNLNGKHFILFKKNVWFFDNESYEDIYEEINKKLGLVELDEELDDDINTSLTTLSQNHPYVLIGQIDKNTIYLYDNGGDYRHSSSSDDLKKLSKKLNMPVKMIYKKDVYRGEEGEFIINLKDKYFYHGTSLKYLNNINKKGIIPKSNQSNFDKIYHRDKIFLTKNLEKALFHANTAAMKTNSFPIILKVKIPDTNKLILDYDLGIDFYGIDYRINKKLGYSNIAKRNKYLNLDREKLKGFEKFNLSKKLGLYGYKGRIPASHIKEVLIDTIALTNNPQIFMPEFDLEYNSELWKQFASVDAWSEISMEEVLKIADNVEDELYAYEKINL